MNPLRKIVMPGLGVLAVLTFQTLSVAQNAPAPGVAPGGPAGGAAPGGGGPGFGAGGAGGGRGGGGGRGATPDHPHVLAPYFAPATASPKAPDADGFLQRWVLLEPINKPNRSNTVFTDSYVRANLTAEYFPNQLTVLPHDGDKVTVAGEELAWRALDSQLFNCFYFLLANLSRQAEPRNSHRQHPSGN